MRPQEDHCRVRAPLCPLSVRCTPYGWALGARLSGSGSWDTVWGEFCGDCDGTGTGAIAGRDRLEPGHGVRLGRRRHFADGLWLPGRGHRCAASAGPYHGCTAPGLWTLAVVATPYCTAA